MLNRIFAVLAAMAAGAAALQAQETAGAENNGPWDLRRCIEYALDRNLTVKSQDITRSRQEIELNTVKNSRLPDLAGSASQNFSFGRGLSENNTYVNTNTASTSFSLGTSVNLFSGFKTGRTIKLNELNLEAATEDLQKAKDDISVSVTEAYLQILYNREILAVARRQVEIDSAQVERLKALYVNGKASAAEVAQQEASLGQSRLTAVQAANTLDLSVLDLSQLLELPSPQNFGIAVPQIPDAVLLPSGSAEEIYAEAVGQRPAVRAEQLRLNAAEMNVGIAKSSLYPSLDLNGGIGTNYYKSSGYAAASFMDQVRNNFSQYVGISLSVPIFSRFATRNSIRSANLSKLSQQVQLENTRKSLYKEIQQAWYNAVASGSKLRSCEDALKSAATSFELIRAKYENGKATATEFSESRTSLMKAESDLLQARFENLFQVKLLDFYRGKPLYSTPENG